MLFSRFFENLLFFVYCVSNFDMVTDIGTDILVPIEMIKPDEYFAHRVLSHLMYIYIDSLTNLTVQMAYLSIYFLLHFFKMKFFLQHIITLPVARPTVRQYFFKLTRICNFLFYHFHKSADFFIGG